MADVDATAALITTRHQPAADPTYQAGSLRLIAELLEVESGAGSLGHMRRETWLATPGATPELVEAIFAPLEAE